MNGLTDNQHLWLSLSRRCKRSLHPLTIELLRSRGSEEHQRPLIEELEACTFCGSHGGLQTYLKLVT